MKIIFFIFQICFSLFFCEKNSYCDKMIKLNSTDTDIKSDIERNFDTIKSDQLLFIFLFRCFEVLLRHGHHSALEYFLGLLLKNNINFKNNLQVSVSKINYELDNIQNKFRFIGGDVIK